VLASNLNAVIWGCKTVGKQMISRRSGGCIINISSLLAYKAAVGTSVYAASKAAQLGIWNLNPTSLVGETPTDKLVDGQA
jgi:NAD(P)-dependent dehydrogenase (short-subunit alcohol dehydrogenase family)